MGAPSLKEKYTLARCCFPALGEAIIGYFSQDDVIKVHRSDCCNLSKTDPQRLVKLEWQDIVVADPVSPGNDFGELEPLDFEVLQHHRDYDIDYSLMVAGELRIPKEEAFERHNKLRNLGLLERVDAVMVRYRKNIASGKWIKHRNHTYYRLTDKGRRYLDWYLDHVRE